MLAARLTFILARIGLDALGILAARDTKARVIKAHVAAFDCG
jgi:hypothetical protein